MLNTTLAKLLDTNLDSYYEVRQIGVRDRSPRPSNPRPHPPSMSRHRRSALTVYFRLTQSCADVASAWP